MGCVETKLLEVKEKSIHYEGRCIVIILVDNVSVDTEKAVMFSSSTDDRIVVLRGSGVIAKVGKDLDGFPKFYPVDVPSVVCQHCGSIQSSWSLEVVDSNMEDTPNIEPDQRHRENTIKIRTIQFKCSDCGGLIEHTED